MIIQRTGGDLVTRYVQYTVIPDGQLEFYGAHNVLKFEPGVHFQNATLLAVMDGLPEVSVSFRQYLSSICTVWHYNVNFNNNCVTDSYIC